MPQNNPVGYDVDVATMIARTSSACRWNSPTCRVTPASRCWSPASSTSSSPTPRRRSSGAKSVNFTIPYNRAGLRVIVQADSGIKYAQGPRRQEDRRRPRHHRRDVHQKGGAEMPSWSMSTSSRPDGVLQLQQKRVDAAIEDLVAARLSRHRRTPSLVTIEGSIPTIRSASPSPRAIRIRALAGHVRLRLHPVGRLLRRTTRSGGRDGQSAGSEPALVI